MITSLVTLLLAAVLPSTPPSPPAVALNQLGFRPADPKRAILLTAGDAPLRWTVTDTAGRVVLEGVSRPGRPDAAGQGREHILDLGALRTPGAGYRVHVGEARSAPFAIRPDLYAPLARDALAFFYHQRAGTPIEARFARGTQWARPAGHPREVAPCFDGADGRGDRWPGCRYTLDVTGGWYDAGDHGKYVVNGGIAVWTLLNLYEWTGGRALPDRSQPVPEAGNGVSDLLDEARWEVEFLLRMQVPDGSRQSVAVGQRTRTGPLTMTEIDTSGMAHTRSPMRSGRRCRPGPTAIRSRACSTRPPRPRR
jgi:endoglucanase